MQIKLNPRILSGAAALTVLAVSARGVELNGDVEMGLSSAHVWRGHVVNDEPVFQPAITVGAYPYSLGVWSTWDLTSTGEASRHQRVDVTGQYSYRRDRHLLDAGLTAYIYPGDATAGPNDTLELFVGYAIDVAGLPSATLYYDFEELDGLYATLGLTHTVPLTRWELELQLGATVGFADGDHNNAAFGVDDASLVDLTLTAALPLPLTWESTDTSATRDLVLTPGIKIMQIIDSDIRDAVADENILVLNLTAIVAF